MVAVIPITLFSRRVFNLSNDAFSDHRIQNAIFLYSRKSYKGFLAVSQPFSLITKFSEIC